VFSAPFQFFSMEHVNFFSPNRFPIFSSAMVLNAGSSSASKPLLGPTPSSPQSAGLFRRTKKNAAIDFDDETEPALQRYIEISRQTEQRIHDAIARLVERQVPLAVWGAGTHTLRLLKTSPLPQPNS